jgi:two-component system, LuxR family, response regulator FixJ
VLGRAIRDPRCMTSITLSQPAGAMPIPSHSADGLLASHSLGASRRQEPRLVTPASLPTRRLHVHVVDADCARRAAIARDLYGKSVHVEIYEDLHELISCEPSWGTVLAHADQPRFDDSLFIETLHERTGYMPIAFYSEAPAPERIVSAMLSGAIDYMRWPSPTGFLDAVMRMSRRGEEKARLEARRHNARRRVEMLTRRERDVLVRLVAGDSNKEIAQHLGISPRTVEIHRSGMLSRLNARSTADAVRIGLHSGLLD